MSYLERVGVQAIEQPLVDRLENMILLFELYYILI